MAEFRLCLQQTLTADSSRWLLCIRILAGDVWGRAHDFADFLKGGSMVVADVPDMQQLECTKAEESSFCIIMMHFEACVELGADNVVWRVQVA